ncbi:MAG: molybdenum cofactor biosynthesis protein MoaE, partial [Candidatus Sericytochromatia bacterium]|nr:molybdenum cofactor biosynthesis protein MoaE [Candidatus Sericytochromatia bacterium]
MIFLISEIPLENSDLKSELLDNKAGGFVCFEGWVRDFNENKEVLML